MLMSKQGLIVGLALFLLSSPWQLGATASAVELSSSVILFYNSELDKPMYGAPVTQCELLLRRAQKHGGRRVQIIPTHYWYDASEASQSPEVCYPDNWADTSLKVDYYCSKYEWNSNCEPFNSGSVTTFKNGMQKCLALALTLFDEVFIAPHLDPFTGGGKRSKWRNMLRFDPLAKDKYGYSYWDLMLEPVLQAANQAFSGKSGKVLYLAMAGEMGGTLLNYPASYLSIINKIRSAWSASSSTLKLGLTFYHAYTPGQINHGPGNIGPLPDSPYANYDGGYGPLLPFDKWPGVDRLKAVLADTKKLLDTVDFIGVSNYARAPANPQPSDLEGSTAKLLAEFKAMGINLDPYFLLSSGRSGSKAFIWNEYGLGGGISSCGDTPGKDAKIGLFPWLGVTSSYNQKLDPFKQSAAAKAYLIKYYDSALKVLQSGGVKYRVDGAYLWNVGSWDVQGIHPSSSVWNTSIEQGDWPVRNGFAVAEVIQAIKSHNQNM